VRDVVRPDVHAALDELGRVLQEPVREPHVGLLSGNEDRIAPEIDVGARLPRKLAEKPALRAREGQKDGGVLDVEVYAERGFAHLEAAYHPERARGPKFPAMRSGKLAGATPAG
jgi:hypothetical protein